MDHKNRCSVNADETDFMRGVVNDLRQDDRRLRRMFDRKVLPAMVLSAFMLGIKSAAFSNADLFGLAEDLDLGHTQFSWLYSLPHLLQIPLQLPIAWIVRDNLFALDKILANCLILSGCLFGLLPDLGHVGSIFSGLVQGLLDAVFVPHLVWISWVYWTPEEMPLRLTLWGSMIGFANVHRRDSATFGCTPIIFAPYMLYTVIFAGASPMELKFLSDRDSKVAYGVQRLTAPRNMSWSDVVFRSTKKDVKTWLWFCLAFTASILTGGLTSVSPRILKALDLKRSNAALLNMPFGATQFLSIMGGGYATTKYRFGTVMTALSLISAVGLMLLHRASQLPELRQTSLLIGYYLSAAVHGQAPLIYSWAGVNTAGSTKQRATVAFLLMGQQLGSACGPVLFNLGSAEVLSSGVWWISILTCLSTVALVELANRHIRNLNRRHAHQGGLQAEDSAVTVTSDSRLNKAIDFERQRQRKTYEDPDDEDACPYSFRSRVWEDFTDLENKEFRFVT
ncbi:hypothetical protein JX265_002045 [Neoarthrinium moseri]|uniref:MFS general substrate transporter n=1 Tax=Neoarthrinium moseri TaxID=1658444 RepID=A0A9Q0AR86_9PEZI|nr:hypothetical protein JX265_002045 [Neoarthrinium moseri]